MGRKIDADELKKYILIHNVGCGCSEDYQESFLGAIDDQPTIQTEIIHCKECKFYTSMIPKDGIGICSLLCSHFGDDGFCSEAERRENG